MRLLEVLKGLVVGVDFEGDSARLEVIVPDLEGGSYGEHFAVANAVPSLSGSCLAREEGNRVLVD